MKINYTKEELKKVVNESNSYHKVLIEFNRSPTSNSYKTLQKRLQEWEINTDHFLNPSEVMKKLHSEGKLLKRDNSEIFIKNSKVKRDTVKKRIINDNFKEYKCVDCGNRGEWLGKKITLILDHINGINNDNRLKNLRFLCPNCNATLPTHCRGSNGLKKKKIKIDGRTIRINRPELRKVERPTKKDLNKMINEMSYCAIGRKYGVSNTAIRKWAEKYGIK